MSVSSLDPYLFYKRDSGKLDDVQVSQVDDTCGGDITEFAALEELKSKELNAKIRTTSFPMKFNGMWIANPSPSIYRIHQH